MCYTSNSVKIIKKNFTKNDREIVRVRINQEERIHGAAGDQFVLNKYK